MSREQAPETRSAGRAFAAYNLLRLLLLAVCFGAGWLAGLRGGWLVIVALLVSGVLSFFLLAKQRIGMGIAVEDAVNRSRVKFAERTKAEDEYDDAMRMQSQRAPEQSRS